MTERQPESDGAANDITRAFWERAGFCVPCARCPRLCLRGGLWLVLQRRCGAVERLCADCGAIEAVRRGVSPPPPPRARRPSREELRRRSESTSNRRFLNRRSR